MCRSWVCFQRFRTKLHPILRGHCLWLVHTSTLRNERECSSQTKAVPRAHHGTWSTSTRNRLECLVSARATPYRQISKWVLQKFSTWLYKCRTIFDHLVERKKRYSRCILLQQRKQLCKFPTVGRQTLAILLQIVSLKVTATTISQKNAIFSNAAINIKPISFFEFSQTAGRFGSRADLDTALSLIAGPGGRAV